MNKTDSEYFNEIVKFVNPNVSLGGPNNETQIFSMEVVDKFLNDAEKKVMLICGNKLSGKSNLLKYIEHSYVS